ncbi:uncharacterized protein Z518_02030 [Rhinocladiella mackenziei CBS 650.93]|uniref:Transcription factor domain-containing protein n=1 Tax=Rhinocladiella mackenziei CBS 650.93 TaxID=1442369 RepID=A0A0D2FYI4_9EURO|nr:uncharacterized protein Z518_02030 [Rhinocladiella mackenziei CBS 650.93]KIX07377.1 hypothetical protein Z518_02030 [Rhinocladiella mackenziei CBS 650.93]
MAGVYGGWSTTVSLGLAGLASRGARSATNLDQCLKSKRACLGYDEAPGYVFRHYVGLRTAEERKSSPQSESTPAVGNIAPSEWDNESSNFDDARLEEGALEAFFNDYCITSRNPTLSRGFLDGLQLLIAHAGPSSDMAKAARIVSLAGIGNKLGRSSLLRRTRYIYGDLLHSFQATISHRDQANTVESLMTAVLLGLYEIITSNEDNPGQHPAHVQGVSAILCSDDSPFNLFAGCTQLFQLSNPIIIKEPLHNVGVLCTPISNSSIQSLDSILVKFNPIFYKAMALLAHDSSPSEEEIIQVRENAMSLRDAFAKWAESQPEEWKPITVSECASRSFAGGFHTTGRIESYFDLYVAAVWNTYRKTHLLMLDVIFKCKRRLGQETGEDEEAQRLAEDIASSVPFHLGNDSDAFPHELHRGTKPMTPGPPVGGLFLLHPLWVITVSSVVSPEIQARMRECLAWIGKNTGLGQATLLSKVRVLLNRLCEQFN